MRDFLSAKSRCESDFCSVIRGFLGESWQNREFKKTGIKLLLLAQFFPLEILSKIGKYCYKTAFGKIWYDFKRFRKSYDQKTCFPENRTLGGFAVLPYLVNYPL